MEWLIGHADVDVRESVSFLNVSVISVPAAVKRLRYDCIVTPLTLSVVESIPEPYTAVVWMNTVQTLSGSYM